MEMELLDFYFKHLDNEDVVAMTCDEFGVSAETMKFIVDCYLDSVET